MAKRLEAKRKFLDRGMLLLAQNHRFEASAVIMFSSPSSRPSPSGRRRSLVVRSKNPMLWWFNPAQGVRRF